MSSCLPVSAISFSGCISVNNFFLEKSYIAINYTMCMIREHMHGVFVALCAFIVENQFLISFHFSFATTKIVEIARLEASWSEAANNSPDFVTVDEFLSLEHPEASPTRLLTLVTDVFSTFGMHLHHFYFHYNNSSRENRVPS